MARPRPAQVASKAAGAALRVSQAAVDVAAGTRAPTARLVVGTARGGARAARAATSTVAITTGAVLTGSARIAARAAVGGLRTTGRLLTGSDPVADGQLQRLAEATKAMFEPPLARRTRRVWVTRGRTHVELAAPALEGPAEVGRTLCRQLERLEGVEWAAVNAVVGRVLVAFDDRRISVDKVVAVVTAFEQARGGEQVFPPREEHPGDLEPLLAAAVAFVVDVAAVGAAYTGKVLPVPALTRHATVVLPLLDTLPWIKRALAARIGTTGTDLVVTGASALLHTAIQSPTVPALYAVAAAARLVEVSSRQAVWQRREPELCRPVADDSATGPIVAPGQRPMPLPDGPIEAYQARLGPWSLGGASLLALTRQPTRSADLLKTLSPMAAVLGREVFAAVVDHLMCRRGVLPMDGSAYRRLDRIDAVVLDSDVLCTGPPAVLAATAQADGWDSSGVWGAVAQLLGPADPEHPAAFDGEQKRLRLGRAEESPDVPGGWVRRLLDGDDVVGAVTIVAGLDPLAEALLAAAGGAGHRLVLTEHAGVRERAGMADEIAPADEPLAETVRRLQADGHGVLAVSAVHGTGLTAADVGIAVPDPERPPAWGADLVTPPGLGEVWRLVTATTRARALSEQAVGVALTGNVLGGLLASVGRPRSGQRNATTPGKFASGFTMAVGIWSALRLNTEPLPPLTVHTPGHALEPAQMKQRLSVSGR